MKKIFVISFICILLVFVFWMPSLMLSPGPLVKGHDEINNKCFSCHTPFVGISNNKCISCHSFVDIENQMKSNVSQLKLSANLHEVVVDYKCIICHKDHYALDFKNKLTKFNHPMLSKNLLDDCVKCHNIPENMLHGRLSTNCKACHQTDSWKSGTVFNHQNMLSEVKDNCTLCHIKPKDLFHEPLVENCNTCHTTDRWIPSTFEHSKYFKLDPDHNVKCVICHQDNNYKNYTCYGCHAHSLENIRAEHNEEGIYQINDCVACHKGSTEQDLKMDDKKRRENNRTEKLNHDD